jgi:hypothetical protein
MGNTGKQRQDGLQKKEMRKREIYDHHVNAAPTELKKFETGLANSDPCLTAITRPIGGREAAPVAHSRRYV